MPQPSLLRRVLLTTALLLASSVAWLPYDIVLPVARAQGLQAGPSQPVAEAPVDPAWFNGLHWRHVGPFRGGRVTAVAGHRSHPGTFYMGSTGGGVWKTTDYGHTWTNISDGYFETASIGAMEVAESNPDVIYVGTGSAAIRSNIIRGLGMYKTTDAGKTWSHIGLRTAGQIGAVRVHPRNPDLVYAAVVGQPFGDSADRGIFRSKDGGRTWEKVFFINERTGVFSLVLDPSNPDVMYATAWRTIRKPWTIVSGGPAEENGIYKSTDGGTTWTRSSNGLPTDLLGKIDVDVARTNPRRLYAIVEAVGDKLGLYRSDDAGASWTQVNGQKSLMARPFYYTYVDVDPKNADVVWVNNLSLWKSTDAGASFTAVPTPHGDNHGMWFNPDDPDLFIQSNDGGVNVTRDGGATWSTQYNQPTAEIYQVDVDGLFPYHVYGAQQDNTTVRLPTNSRRSSAPDDPVQYMTEAAGCETGPVKPKPDDPEIIYGVCKGEFSRLNLRTGQEQHFWVYPQNRYGHASRDIRYRFQRTSPFEISPHDPNVIYHTSHVVHRTKDEGRTWEVISPDLTANLPEGQGISGEPITRDITGEEVYATIYAFRESPLEPGLLWSGANDGPVFVSRDGGGSWSNVTPAGLPPGGRVQHIEVSPHRKGSAYIAYYRYLLDDWAPYLYRTDDYGRTWTRLTDGRNGIPSDYPTRVVREDPDREGLLYAGTEFGMYVSFDNGVRWQRWQLDLPVTPVTDMLVHGKDLVVSTMGRGFWVLDDLSRLHRLPLDGATAAASLVAPRQATRARLATVRATTRTPDYPGALAIVDYHLAKEAREVTLEIRDLSGAIVRTFRSEGDGPQAETTQEMRAPRRRTTGAPVLGRTAGAHRLTWDMRAGEGYAAPMVPPGTYEVRLAADGVTDTQPLTLVLDPRVAADGVTQVDLDQQYAFVTKITETVAEARALAGRVTTAREQAANAGATAKVEALREVEAALVTAGGAYPQPMLIDQLGNLLRMLVQADQPVSQDARERYDHLVRELAAIGQRADGLL